MVSFASADITTIHDNLDDISVLSKKTMASKYVFVSAFWRETDDVDQISLNHADIFQMISRLIMTLIMTVVVVIAAVL